MNAKKLASRTLLTLSWICAICAVLTVLRVYAICLGTGQIWIPNRFELYQIMQGYGILYALPFGVVGLAIYWVREKLLEGHYL